MIAQKYRKRIREIDSLLCIGLDSDYTKTPEQFQAGEYPQFEFNQWVIDQTAEFTSSYKINTAFYEALGIQGYHSMRLTLSYIQEKHPDIVTICDAKRADIGNTNEAYIKAYFDTLAFDAITLHPYLGQEAIQAFLDRKDKASIILCHTSNPGAAEFQDLKSESGETLWQIVAKNVSQIWNQNQNCMLVVGATYPEQMQSIRAICGDEMIFLVPGIGAQGGDLAATLQAGLNKQGEGLIISASRSIIFAQNPAQEAKHLKEQINHHRMKV